MDLDELPFVMCANIMLFRCHQSYMDTSHMVCCDRSVATMCIVRAVGYTVAHTGGNCSHDVSPVTKCCDIMLLWGFMRSCVAAM